MAPRNHRIVVQQQRQQGAPHSRAIRKPSRNLGCEVRSVARRRPEAISFSNSGSSSRQKLEPASQGSSTDVPGQRRLGRTHRKAAEGVIPMAQKQNPLNRTSIPASCHAGGGDWTATEQDATAPLARPVWSWRAPDHLPCPVEYPCARTSRIPRILRHSTSGALAMMSSGDSWQPLR